MNKAARFDPTVVLMDTRMPELDGLEATACTTTCSDCNASTKTPPERSTALTASISAPAGETSRGTTIDNSMHGTGTDARKHRDGKRLDCERV